ncbi:MAG: PEFG-CTERM sorting domain-containing protein [Thaumarchaeota archaeon]|nr:PEFG-CTERM sorting domain-containing protein [Nitrososphaerota archaeon]
MSTYSSMLNSHSSNGTIGTPSSGSLAVTVSTDKASYNDGDKVLVSGTTRDYLGDTPLTLILRNPVGNIIKVDQITVGTDKTFSSTITATGLLWQAAGTYTVSVQYGTPDRSAKTTFQFSGSSGGGSGPGTIPVDGTNYMVTYTIINGKVLDIKADPQSKSLTVSIQTTGDGQLTITMPRALIDAKKSDGTDDKFVVLNDGQENSQANETITTSTDRTLAIPFKNGTSQIEIIGTFVIPEFGPIAALVLTIAVISIIALSAKTGLRFSPRY